MSRHAESTLRMLGENITLARFQWEQLADMLDPAASVDERDARELAARIRSMLSDPPETRAA